MTISQIIMDMFCLSWCHHFVIVTSFMTHHQMLNTRSTIYATSRAGTAYYTGVIFRFNGIAFVVVFFWLMFCEPIFTLFFFSWHCIECPSSIVASWYLHKFHMHINYLTSLHSYKYYHNYYKDSCCPHSDHKKDSICKIRMAYISIIYLIQFCFMTILQMYIVYKKPCIAPDLSFWLNCVIVNFLLCFCLLIIYLLN